MKKEFKELFEIMELDLKNSSWSKQQDLQSRLIQLKGELEEVEKAIENNDLENLQDELGDVFLDLMAIMVLIEQKKHFQIRDSLKNAIAKYKRRKGWVFNNEKLSPEEEVNRWNEAKKKEKKVYSNLKSLKPKNRTS
ncbi:nucleotide pyrophosphohydrolase [Candidatus Micrarchaeota archaeon]|nr:nucleotide pyrophosphohydrolase [Candidatus Micrarchaeota archaeon]